MDKLFLVERLYLRRETYFSILMDRASNGPVMVGSPQGGTSIEDVARDTPDQIFTEAIDINTGPTEGQLLGMAKNLGFPKEAQEEATVLMNNLYTLFIETGMFVSS